MATEVISTKTLRVGIVRERAKLVLLAICARALLRTIEEYLLIFVGKWYASFSVPFLRLKIGVKNFLCSGLSFR